AGRAAPARNGHGRGRLPHQAVQPQAPVPAHRPAGGDRGRGRGARAVKPWAVVLAGGVGSRFWPLSTPERPKQLLPLVGERSLLEDTLQRLQPLAGADRTLILTNAQLAERVREMAPEVPDAQVIAEPRPAGTAAALAFAALRVQQLGGDDAVMVCVHADWAIGNDEGFRDALRKAASAADELRALVT